MRIFCDCIFRVPSAWGAALLVMMLSGIAIAQPTLTVTNNGENANSNLEWLVQIAPDTTLFSDGDGAIGLELAFEVTTGTLVSATHDATLWPFLNPGNNPFTDSVTLGLQTDTSNATVFASLGSNPFDSADAVTVLTIETAGVGATTLSWGGHTLLAGSDFEYVGSRIAQNDQNYDGFMGTISSQGGTLVCDFNADGGCDDADIDLLYDAFGTNGPEDLSNNDVVGAEDIDLWLVAASSTSNPLKLESDDVYKSGDVNLDGSVLSSDLGVLLNNFLAPGDFYWENGDLDGSKSVDSADLGRLLNQFGHTSALSASAVPEPDAAGLAVLAIWGLLAVRRCTRRRTVC